jgi:hypothetical protein
MLNEDIAAVSAFSFRVRAFIFLIFKRRVSTRIALYFTELVMTCLTNHQVYDICREQQQLLQSTVSQLLKVSPHHP